MLADLSVTLHPSTKVCVACDLTLPTEYIKTKTAKSWKSNTEDLHKRPAMFIVQRD